MIDTDSFLKEINQGFDTALASTANESIAEPIPTGILPLDVAIGIGGLPKGRVIEMHAAQSVGKSSLCLAIIASFQKRGLNCAYIDTEFSFLTDYAKQFGVDTEQLILLRTTYGEQAFEAMERLIRSNKIHLIVVDSVSGMTPQKEAEGEHGKPTIGEQSKMISKGLAKILGPMYRSGTVVIFINQLRVNIMGGQYDPFTLPGGLSLRHYASIMLDMHRKGALMQGDVQVGIEVEIKVKKNKVAPPGEKCVVQLFFTKGFSAEADVIGMAEKMGIITTKGNTYYFGEEKLGVGRARTRTFLEKNGETMAKIKALLESPK